MAKKPQDGHARELWAFQTGRITREEYKDCWHGHSAVIGNKFYDASDKGAMYWTVRKMEKPKASR